MQKSLRLFTLALAVVLLAGCGPADTNLTEANNGQSTTIHIGGKVVVQLQANPSTGYTWDVGQVDSKILLKVGQTEYTSSSATPLPGGGGIQTLRFQAIASGTTALLLNYHRPFEVSTPPIQTFEVRVMVVP